MSQSRLAAFAPRRSRSERGFVPQAATIVSVTATVALVALTRTMGDFGNSVVLAGAESALIAAGLHALVHWAGQISIAQIAFAGVGAFVTARANGDFGVPLELSILLGVAAAVAASATIGVPALRIRGFALAIATLAFGFAADRWLFLQTWLVPQGAGVPLADRTLFGLDVRSASGLVVPVVVVTVLALLLTRRLGRSPLGQATRLVAHDEEVASSFGVNAGSHKLLVFLFAGGMAGLAGAITVMSLGRAGPSVFPPTHSVLVLSAVLVGGPGAVWGSVVAAVAFAVVPLVAQGLGRFLELAGLLGIIHVVVVSPGGINGMFRNISSRGRKRIGTPEESIDG